MDFRAALYATGSKSASIEGSTTGSCAPMTRFETMSEPFSD
jgi:hypothetical protein